jgi:hypothetical protein
VALNLDRLTVEQIPGVDHLAVLDEVVRAHNVRFSAEFTLTGGHPSIGRIALATVAQPGELFSAGSGILSEGLEQSVSILMQEARWPDQGKAKYAAGQIGRIKLQNQEPIRVLPDNMLGVALSYERGVDMLALHRAVQEKLTAQGASAEHIGPVAVAARPRRRRSAATKPRISAA